MRDALIHFLDRIKDYEHESGHSMHEDERESSEIVDIHLEAVPELKNYVSISNVSVCFVVVDDDSRIESIHKTKELAEKEIEDWKRFNPSKCVSIQERELN